MRGNYSVKSDVFSFGVMVLEIVTGKKNNDCYTSRLSEDLLTLVSDVREYIFSIRCLKIVAAQLLTDCHDLNDSGVGALDGRVGIRADRPVLGRRLLPDRRTAVHPHRAAVRAGRPGGPACDVDGGHDARQRHGVSPGPAQAGVLRQEKLGHVVQHVDGVSIGSLLQVQNNVAAGCSCQSSESVAAGCTSFLVSTIHLDQTMV